MIQPVLLFLALLTPGAGPETKRFSEVEIERPFDGYLLASPLLMEVTGAKIIRLPNGNQVVLAVASTVLKDKSAEDRLRAERVCRVKALASLVAEKSGVQVAHVEQLKEKTVVILDNGKETGKSVSELLQITKTKVQGITKDMPVIGRWKSKEGDVFYLAIGVILDKAGAPIRVRPAK
jgi:5,10-methylene-tetrahydrofolate dehydrogenase/methenyl tetrahydrofolate cyclohydrolase